MTARGAADAGAAAWISGLLARDCSCRRPGSPLARWGAPLAFASVLALPSPAHAQDAAPEHIRPVIVQRESGGELRGHLLQLGPEALTLLVEGRRMDVPFASVTRIDSGKDSIRNGAWIGALIGGGLCAVACWQGAPDDAFVPVAITINAVFWGAVGAGVDAMIPGRTTIYRRPAPPPVARAAIAYRVRF